MLRLSGLLNNPPPNSVSAHDDPAESTSGLPAVDAPPCDGPAESTVGGYKDSSDVFDADDFKDIS